MATLPHVNSNCLRRQGAIRALPGTQLLFVLLSIWLLINV